jgi:biopolymer transport protein ExbD
MRLSRPSRPPSRTDAMLPMMNVVLLLLVFMMLMGGVALAPDPVLAPRSTQATPLAADAAVPELQLDADGVLRDRDGVAVELARWMTQSPPPQSLRLHADAQAPGPVVVGLLQALQAAGVSRVQLLATQRQ